MADRGIEGWTDKAGGTGLPKKLISDLQNLKLRKEVLPRTPPPHSQAEDGASKPGLWSLCLALQGA